MTAPQPLSFGSMCTGYGGLDLAVSAVLDIARAWVADPDLGAAAILAHHWPHVPSPRHRQVGPHPRAVSSSSH